MLGREITYRHKHLFRSFFKGIWSDCACQQHPHTSPVPYQTVQMEKLFWSLSLSLFPFPYPHEVKCSTPANSHSSFFLQSIGACSEVFGSLWCWLNWSICVQYDSLILRSVWLSHFLSGTKLFLYFLFHRPVETTHLSLSCNLVITCLYRDRAGQ